MFKTRIIWKGNIISCMKSFGKRSCKLCMKERIAILEVLENHPGRLMNSRSEAFGGCRHVTRFHGHLNRPHEHPSTDDRLNPERVKFGYNGLFLNWWNDFFPIFLKTSQPAQIGIIACVSLLFFEFSEEV